MERLISSSDHFPHVTADVRGVEQTYPVGLRLTYDFDPKLRQMAIAVGLLPPANADDLAADEDARWKNVFYLTRDKTVVQVMVTTLSTTATLLMEAKLPHELRFAVQHELEQMARKLEPFVLDCFDGRTCAPSLEPVQAQTPEPAADTVPIPRIDLATMPDPVLVPEPEPQPPAEPAPAAPAAVTPQPVAPNNVLVFVKRDVSPAFKRERGACTLQYTLFSESHAFRAIVEASVKNPKTGAVRSKSAEFIRRDVESILRDLHNDATAYEVASFFGDTDSRTVHRMSCVLQTGFAGGTRHAMETGGKAYTLPNTQATIALTPADPKEQSFVEVFNNGQYIRVPA